MTYKMDDNNEIARQYNAAGGPKRERPASDHRAMTDREFIVWLVTFIVVILLVWKMT